MNGQMGDRSSTTLNFNRVNHLEHAYTLMRRNPLQHNDLTTGRSSTTVIAHRPKTVQCTNQVFSMSRPGVPRLAKFRGIC